MKSDLTESPTRYCTECLAETSAEDMFCQECGVTLPADEEPGAVSKFVQKVGKLKEQLLKLPSTIPAIAGMPKLPTSAPPLIGFALAAFLIPWVVQSIDKSYDSMSEDYIAGAAEKALKRHSTGEAAELLLRLHMERSGKLSKEHVNMLGNCLIMRATEAIQVKDYTTAMQYLHDVTKDCPQFAVAQSNIKNLERLGLTTTVNAQTPGVPSMPVAPVAAGAAGAPGAPVAGATPGVSPLPGAPGAQPAAAVAATQTVPAVQRVPPVAAVAPVTAVPTATGMASPVAAPESAVNGGTPTASLTPANSVLPNAAPGAGIQASPATDSSSAQKALATTNTNQKATGISGPAASATKTNSPMRSTTAAFAPPPLTLTLSQQGENPSAHATAPPLTNSGTSSFASPATSATSRVAAETRSAQVPDFLPLRGLDPVNSQVSTNNATTTPVKTATPRTVSNKSAAGQSTDTQSNVPIWQRISHGGAKPQTRPEEKHKPIAPATSIHSAEPTRAANNHDDSAPKTGFFIDGKEISRGSGMQGSEKSLDKNADFSKKTGQRSQQTEGQKSYDPDDISRYNELLANYFRQHDASATNAKETAGTEPPSFQEWVSKGKTGFR